MFGLLLREELPEGFSNPPEFLRVVELELTNLEPWWVIQGDLLCQGFAGLKHRYPDRVLVPLAVRQDNDDIACWDLQSGRVVVIHDFASPGWGQRREFADFCSWLRQAVEDLIAFEPAGDSTGE